MESHWPLAPSCCAGPKPSTQAKEEPMTHLTLNTGHSLEVARLLTPEERATCLTLWPKGGNLPPPLAAFRVDFGGNPGAASFCVWRAGAPICLNIVCWEAHAAEAAWQAIEKQYFSLSETPVGEALGTEYSETPDPPWLATLLLPGLGITSQDDISWLGSFEQAMALTIIETNSP